MLQQLCYSKPQNPLINSIANDNSAVGRMLRVWHYALIDPDPLENYLEVCCDTHEISSWAAHVEKHEVWCAGPSLDQSSATVIIINLIRGSLIVDSYYIHCFQWMSDSNQSKEQGCMSCNNLSHVDWLLRCNLWCNHHVPRPVRRRWMQDLERQLLVCSCLKCSRSFHCTSKMLL